MTVAYRIARAKKDIDAVYEAGKKAEYNTFWDAFQRNGTRTAYYGTFVSFNRDVFYPKYDIKLAGSTGAFSTFRTFPESCATWPLNEDFDLAGRLAECGVRLDTSEATQLHQTFYYSCITHLPALDLSNVTSGINEAFYYCNRLHTIDKIILSNDGTQTFSNAFGSCIKLENIIFEGVIGSNISFAQSTLLTRASIENIISVLSANSSGKTLTLSKAAVDTAFTDAEWTALANTRTNWTISLV